MSFWDFSWFVLPLFTFFKLLFACFKSGENQKTNGEFPLQNASWKGWARSDYMEYLKN